MVCHLQQTPKPNKTAMQKKILPAAVVLAQPTGYKKSFILIKLSYIENPFAVIFVLVAWAGERYEVDLTKTCFLVGPFSQDDLFTIGFTVGDLGAILGSP